MKLKITLLLVIVSISSDSLMSQTKNDHINEVILLATDVNEFTELKKEILKDLNMSEFLNEKENYFISSRLLSGYNSSDENSIHYYLKDSIDILFSIDSVTFLNEINFLKEQNNELFFVQDSSNVKFVAFLSPILNEKFFHIYLHYLLGEATIPTMVSEDTSMILYIDFNNKVLVFRTPGRTVHLIAYIENGNISSIKYGRKWYKR